VTDNVFDGDVQSRLRRASARLRAASLDAQARDWTAERPDRVGFTRLAQARWHLTEATGRFGPELPPDWIRQVLANLTGVVVTLVVLLAAGRPVSLPILLGAIVAGPFVTQLVISAVVRFRLWRAASAPSGPAAIDDEHFPADLTRRLEACAAAARADRSEKHRAAAGDIAQALECLAGAQVER
jgi:hypothetical protein